MINIKPLKVVEWAAVVCVVTAAALTSFDITSINKILFFLGNSLWMVVAYYWRQWSLFVVNAIMNVFYLYGIITG